MIKLPRCNWITKGDHRERHSIRPSGSIRLIIQTQEDVTSCYYCVCGCVSVLLLILVLAAVAVIAVLHQKDGLVTCMYLLRSKPNGYVAAHNNASTWKVSTSVEVADPLICINSWALLTSLSAGPLKAKMILMMSRGRARTERAGA